MAETSIVLHDTSTTFDSGSHAHVASILDRVAFVRDTAEISLEAATDGKFSLWRSEELI